MSHHHSQPVAADATVFPTFTITINDTAPIWGYCSQTGHCGSGMVFSINAVESGPNNFANFVQLAKLTANSTASSSAPGASSSSSKSSNAAPVQTQVSWTMLGIFSLVVMMF